MANALLAWDNYLLGISGVRNAVLYTPSEAAGLPISNLQSPIGSPATAWQTAAGVVTSAAGARFGLETDNVLPIGALVLARTNLTPAATIRWVLNYGTAAGDPASIVWDSGTLPAGVIKGFGRSVIIPPPGLTCGSFHCYIDDPTNPDGFINIPLSFIGATWQPASNVSPATTQGRDDQTTVTTTRGGQEYPQVYWTRQRAELDFQGIRSSEIWPQVDALDQAGRSNVNCLFVPDPVSPNIGRETILGRLIPRADIGLLSNAQDRRTWKATITERL